MVQFPILYKHNSKGGVEQWQIFVEGDTFYTESGQQGGKLTRTKGTVALPKNVGKSNETTPEQQALLEATAKHQKKLDTHYNEVLTSERSFFEPMLAKKVSEGLKHIQSGKYRMFVQPKYDGVRAINQNGKLTSRGGKEWVTCPHLAQDAVILDGELYNHNYAADFNGLISMFKQQKPDAEELELCRLHGEMWVYDMPSAPGVFSERYAALEKWFETNTNPMLKLVPTFEVTNEDDIDKFYQIFLKDGYEGLMVRLDMAEYEQKRTYQLLKGKKWEDGEFKIVGFVEGKGNKLGMVGSVLLRMPNGQTCSSNMEGSHEYSQDLWENRDLYLGKTATVKYQGFTPEGKLRIPYIKTIGREDYETI